MVEQFELNAGPYAEDPYSVIARLREEAPLFWHEKLNAYLVSRYDDVKTVIEDNTRFFASPNRTPPRPDLAISDGDQHRRLRKLVTPAFSPRALATSIEPALAGVAHELIDRFVARGSANIVSEFADPMVLAVVSRLLNVPAVDQPWLAVAATEMLEAEADTTNAAMRARYDDNVARLDAFFRGIVEKERRTPSGTLMSDLVAAEEQGHLSTTELLAVSQMVVRAGLETTKRLIASLLYALLCNPAQFAALRAEPSLLKSAIEEALRYYPPNQVRIRYVGPEVVLHGVTIKSGTKMYALKGGANRDPRIWKNPEQFDITRFRERGQPSHMSFGWGPHQCLGAYLARTEVMRAMEALLARVTDIELDPHHAVRFVGFRNRGPEALHILFRTPSAGQELLKAG